MKINFFLSKIFTIFLSFIIFELSFPRSIQNLKAKENATLDSTYLKRIPRNDYLLAPGDTLSVIVSREYPELTSDVIIDGEGTIILPKLRTVYVNGLSIKELTKLLNESFKEFVKYPTVEITIKKYRPVRVFVQGEVSNPGLKSLPGSLFLSGDFQSTLNSAQLPNIDSFYFPTVFDAIQSSEGITEFSDLSQVEIIRKNSISNGGGKIKAVVNIYDLIERGSEEQNIRIYSSDLITIKRLKEPKNYQLSKAIQSNLNKKFIEVVVVGRVNNPGKVKLTKASTLNDAIDVAGGLQVLNGPIRFLRFNNDGTIDKRKFGYKRKYKRGSYKNPFLKENDLIFIDKGALAVSNEFITDVVKPFNGLLSIYGLIKVLQD